MKKVILILLFLLYGSNLWSYPEEGGKMKKVVMIIAQENFRDEELLEPRRILEKNGIEVKVASTTLRPVKGMLGAIVKPDLLVKDINVEDFDAIIFVGGIGASQYWDDPQAHKLAQQAYNSDRIVAAICIAPVTLAKANLLKGKHATAWSSEAEILKKAGANYTGRPVERDGNIITAFGPQVAGQFGEELKRALLTR
ncbi:MAG: DJ-1/PfpI family protein [Candidatus Omnitrophica bacterium]|nr:DJ-1/PfpI family protein [Candidatus Omnitrophota bacterium]